MRSNTNPKMLDAIKGFVKNNHKLQLKEGFKFAYTGLLDLLVDNDYETISKACEGNLSNAFAQSLDHFKEKKIGLEVLNARNHTWDLEVIDFHHYVGVKIDRKENKRKGVKEFNPFMMDLPNVTIYNSGNPISFATSLIKSRSAGGTPLITDFTIEILTRIRTNYKLNVT